MGPLSKADLGFSQELALSSIHSLSLSLSLCPGPSLGHPKTATTSPGKLGRTRPRGWSVEPPGFLRVPGEPRRAISHQGAARHTPYPRMR